MSKNRFAVFPSRSNLVYMKLRTAGSVRGLHLLKRKRDALELQMRELRSKSSGMRPELMRVMREAIFSLAKVNFLAADMKPVELSEPTTADMYVIILMQKFVGTNLPAFKLVSRPPTCVPLTGLSRGGHQVEVMRELFRRVLTILIEMGSIECTIKVLATVIKRNNMRVNGLEYVLVPKFKNTMKYINEELEELEREDFYRLKRSQAKQRERKAAQNKLIDNYHGGTKRASNFGPTNPMFIPNDTVEL